MDSSTLQPHDGGLMITSEMVLDTVRRDIEVYGLDEAIKRFERVRSYFAAIPGWAETVRQVDDLFIEERRRLKKEKARPLTVNQNLNLTMKGNNLSYNEVQ